MEKPVKINQVTEKANSSDKPVDSEYVLDDGKSEVEEDKKNIYIELEDDDVEDSDDTKDNNTSQETR